MNKVNENKENKSVEEKSNKSLGILLLFLFTIIPFWWVWLIIGVVKICQREGVKKFIKVQSKKAKQFIKTHKKVSAIVAVGLVGVVALAIAIPQIQSYLEKNREYFIDVEENMSFDCEATEEERTGQLACKERIITGTFSEYPTTKFSDAAIEINGDGFSKLFTHYIEESLYKTEDFDDVKLDSGIDMTIVVELYDSVVERNVIKKEISVHFDLNEDDVVLISQKNEEWESLEKGGR